MYEHKTSGTCSSRIYFDIKDSKVHSVSFEHGCDGNLKALSILVEGMDAGEVVRKLKGLRCGNKKTSCADQLASAIADAITEAIAATTENRKH
ncbi:MAG: TIGR03905 family TSCPD domain-containing protein [Treponema sp.]|jgi:uncharacterized protein (TIGR03905 family)|nr:TIGR03905 family TSCPD domain-containing protein [Treponema sp.]